MSHNYLLFERRLEFLLATYLGSIQLHMKRHYFKTNSIGIFQQSLVRVVEF